jgi:hypothetical protein
MTRTYALNAVIASVPDLLIGWAVAHLTGSGWSGFFITLIVLQAIYFFFWLKRALWSWLVFWFYGKQKMVANLENSLIDSRFPIPDEYTTHVQDYFREIRDNGALDATMRVGAASSCGFIEGLKAAGRYSAVAQFFAAGNIAMRRYREGMLRWPKDRK